jgi:hypothetical protein
MVDHYAPGSGPRPTARSKARASSMPTGNAESRRIPIASTCVSLQAGRAGTTRRARLRPRLRRRRRMPPRPNAGRRASPRQQRALLTSTRSAARNPRSSGRPRRTVQRPLSPAFLGFGLGLAWRPGAASGQNATRRRPPRSVTPLARSE